MKPTETKAVVHVPSPTPSEALRAYLWERKVHFQKMIPPGTVSVDGLLASAMLATKKIDALLACEPASVFLALMDAAALGLTVHWGPRADAVLIPYKKQCQLIIGYRGYIRLMLRSGLVASVHADVVRDGDEWMFSVTEKGVRFRHTPAEDEDPPAEPTRYYAVAFLSGGGCQMARLSLEKFGRIRDTQLAKLQDWQRKTSPYELWPVEMGIKGAIRQLIKLVPMGAVEEAQEIEERHERNVAGVRVDVPKTRAPSLVSESESTTAEHLESPPPQPKEAAPTVQTSSARKSGLIVDESTTPDEELRVDAFLAELGQASLADLPDLVTRAAVVTPDGHPRRAELGRAIAARTAALKGGGR